MLTLKFHFVFLIIFCYDFSRFKYISSYHASISEPPSAKLSSSQRANAPSRGTINKIVVSNGKSVTIICSVQGKPLPLIRWFKEGKAIKVDGVKYHTQGDELYIKSATVEDGGTYGCVAENMAGRNTASFNLIVGGKKCDLHGISM